MAPVPTPEVLWRKPPVLALAALSGSALGRLGEPSTASSAAWAAAGAALRTLHDAPLPPWPGRSLDELASRLARECEWLVAHDVLPADVVTPTAGLPKLRSGPGHLSSSTAICRSTTSLSPVMRSPASSTGPRRLRATRSSTWPPSRSDTKSTLVTSSPATAPKSTATSSRLAVVAMPVQRPLAGGARLRPARGNARGRGAAIPDVREKPLAPNPRTGTEV